MLSALWRLSARIGGRARGLGAALARYYGFVWLSPRVYYRYDQAAIPGLPWQIVVRAPPGPGRPAALLTFSARPTLSDHGQGALGRGMVGAALLRRPKSRHSPKSPDP